MPTLIDMLKSAGQIDARLSKSKQVTLVPQGGAPVQPVATLYAVYKITDGEKGDRASKAGLTKEEAEQYAKDRPDNVYEIVEDD